MNQKNTALDGVKQMVADGVISQDVVEKYFPELKESEDERIRKSIINLVIKSAQNGGMALHKWESQQMLAWLEKQSKKANEIKPRYKEG